jgi:hypothetical protein
MPYPFGELPLLHKEWLYVDPKRVFAATVDTPLLQNTLNTLSPIDIIKIDLEMVVKEHVSYPRFDLEESLYKIKRDSFNLLPDGRINLDFEATTDNRSLELLERSSKYDKVYVYYSGGIDSTLILSAMIKNWSRQDLEKVVLVMNEHSIKENPKMYESYIKDKFRTEDTASYFTGKTTLTNQHIYVTGDLGGPLSHVESIPLYEEMFPSTYKESWSTQKDNIIQFFSHGATKDAAVVVFDMISRSLEKNKVNVDSVFDFMWWVSFNWGYDIDMYHLPMLHSTLDVSTDTEQFMKQNHFLWFNSVDYQNWSMSTIGTDLKIGHTLNSQKYSMKRYIYEFNRDKEYFDTKRQEFSVSKTKIETGLPRIPVGMDTEFNIFYRDTKSVK